MAPRKGQGKSKGKRPAKRMAPEISPPRPFSSDEEDWPVWTELQSKLQALESRQAAQGAATGGPAPAQGRAREVRARKKARFRAMADNLLSRFTALEAALDGASTSQAAAHAGPSQVSSGQGEEGRSGDSDVQTDLEADQQGIAGQTVAGQEQQAHCSGECISVNNNTAGNWPWDANENARSSSQRTVAQNVTTLGGTHFTPGEAIADARRSEAPNNQATVGRGSLQVSVQVQTSEVTKTADLSKLPPSEVPYGDQSLPLGEHLTASLRARIINGSYVDLFSLLNVDLEERDLTKEDEQDKERRKRRKPERIWPNWLAAYTIYMGVITRAQPERALALIQYLDIIHRAYTDFPGQTWLCYDEQFRKRAASRPGIRWDEPLAGLWLQIMTPVRPMAGERFDSGHLIKRAAQQNTPRVTAGNVVQPRIFCWAFNRQGGCSRRQCRFKHECSVCAGNHSAISCFKTRNQKGGGGAEAGGGRRQAAMPNNNKGPQSN